MDRQQTSRCELCGRGEVTLTEHHLIPKEMGGTFLDTAIDMYSMSKQIHALYTNEELASRLGSIEKLRTDEKPKYIKWGSASNLLAGLCGPGNPTVAADMGVRRISGLWRYWRNASS